MRPWFTAGALALAACGTGRTGEAVRPATPTVAGALGEASCTIPEDRTSPLVVDWKPHQRADLEVAMGGGLAVVAYTCNSLRLLPRCRVRGKYDYVGVTSKEEVLQLASADEVRAALPRSGAALGADLAADFERGATLDVAMVLVGKKQAAVARAKTTELDGECEGATHFVRSAALGAFATDAGTRGSARTVAEIFGGGASARSSSALKQRSRDGSLEACRQASPGDASPPSQCAALLRVELVELEKPAPAAATPAPARRTPSAPAPAGRCGSGNPEACRIACEAGDPRGCCQYGAARIDANDPAAGYSYSQRACQGGDPYCCNNVGALFENGQGVSANLNVALSSYVRACDADNELGCHNWIVLANKMGNGARALAEVRARCTRGSRAACEGVRTATGR